MAYASKSAFLCRTDKRVFFSSKFLLWMKWNLFYKSNDYDDSYQNCNCPKAHNQSLFFRIVLEKWINNSVYFEKQTDIAFWHSGPV